MAKKDTVATAGIRLERNIKQETSRALKRSQKGGLPSQSVSIAFISLLDRHYHNEEG
jgi:hypothetical protein